MKKVEKWHFLNRDYSQTPKMDIFNKYKKRYPKPHFKKTVFLKITKK